MGASKLFRVESFVQSKAIKAPVRTETTAPITLSGLQTVNGVVLVARDRVLVKDQADAIENGIYEAQTSAWNRAPDFDGERDATNGTVIVVARSTLVALWQQNSVEAFTPGTDSVTFVLLANATLAGDLASSATGLGASLVAIEDAAGNFTAANVEAALAEIIADLLSTATGLGASIVGIEDVAGDFSGDEVEAALVELKADIADKTNGDTVLTFFKPIDTSRSNTVALTDDPHLAAIVLPVGHWAIEGWLDWTQSGGGVGDGIQIRFNISAGAGAGFGSIQFANQVASAIGTCDTAVLDLGGSTRAITDVGTQNDHKRGHYRGTVDVTTQLTCAIQWAQNVADASSATILAVGSWLKFTRLGNT